MSKNNNAVPLLTIEMLKAKGPCDRLQLEVFIAVWPHGAPITLANIQRARELALDLDWLAEAFLTPSMQETYKQSAATAWAEFKRATHTALNNHTQIKARWEVVSPAAVKESWAAYKHIQSLAWNQRNHTMDPILVAALITSLTPPNEA